MLESLLIGIVIGVGIIIAVSGVVYYIVADDEITRQQKIELVNTGNVTIRDFDSMPVAIP